MMLFLYTKERPSWQITNVHTSNTYTLLNLNVQNRKKRKYPTQRSIKTPTLATLSPLKLLHRFLCPPKISLFLCLHPRETANMDKKPCDDSGKSKDAEVRKGPWTMEEDLILINYIANHGEGVWNSLAKAAGKLHDLFDVAD